MGAIGLVGFLLLRWDNKSRTGFLLCVAGLVLAIVEELLA